MSASNRQVHILIVDDTAINRQTLSAILEEENYHIVAANSGEQALDILAKEHDFALILMDVNMPGLNGFETVNLIKSRPKCADIPVIFLTGLNLQDDQLAQAYSTGAIDFLSKPYNPYILLAKVAAFVDMHLIKQQMKDEIKTRKEHEHDLHLASQVFMHTSEAIMITDKRATIKSVNPAFEVITGYSAQEAVGKTPNILHSGRHSNDFFKSLWAVLKKSGCWEGEIYNRRKSGEIYPEWLKIFAATDSDNNITHYISSFTDIVMHKSSRQRLYNMAHYDNITKLPNRAKFSETLDHELTNAQRRESIMAVFFLDLDNFKSINDTLGHAAGDSLLREVARRLQQCNRGNDLIARQGGDEFTGILVDLVRVEDAAIVATRMLKSIAEPINLDVDTVQISGSIGISIYPHDGDSAAALTSKADTAMYYAKEMGRNNYQFHTKQMFQNSMRRIELEKKLRHAIKHQEFELHFQPQIDTTTRQIIGAETLIRWNHPEEGMISPVEFIPLAEETGLITNIGEWVLNAACMQAKAWLDQGLPPIMLSVNLSSCQFRKKNFIQLLHKTLSDSGYPPEWLQLELTERIIMHDDSLTAERLQIIHDIGIHLSIDDFGTGYSSMGYLKRFPLNEVKIDKSFIDDVCTSEDDNLIVSAIINLAHGLNLTVVAEGVEEKGQLDWLQANNCDVIQGYYFSRPLDASAFLRFMREHQTQPNRI